ncbi:putative FPP GGPP synthase family protein [Lyophyllum shimeji]|uniref:(2E,6E)-farnesyl diphosphate synthase n=1 Tax=Lyophyllum shimeji TaxID=47721 RepID=A0A9P3PT86_LYOSH|nr:putative FPP GGPP synthase family protein [Lyophyllum shimeji]
MHDDVTHMQGLEAASENLRLRGSSLLRRPERVAHLRSRAREFTCLVPPFLGHPFRVGLTARGSTGLSLLGKGAYCCSKLLHPTSQPTLCDDGPHHLPVFVPSAPSAPTSRSRPDPFVLLAPQLTELRQSLLSLLDSGHPRLSEITRYYFLHPSKQIRPIIILLFSRATNGLGRQWSQKLWEAQTEAAGARAEELDWPLTRPDVLNDWNPSMPTNTARFNSTFTLRPLTPHRPPPPKPPQHHTPRTLALYSPTYVLPTQTRLAQIVEMMHTASLLHDDVIDESALRRGSPSAPAAFGNKLSILGGNFVLGRASGALSRLGDPEVTDLIASVLSNLVEGEILQTKAVETQTDGAKADAMPEGVGVPGEQQAGWATHNTKIQDAWNIYLQKTYLKTASLMAKGARAAVTLGGCKEGDIWREIAYAYGRNLGIAFQLVDDILDYDSASATLGKPGGADLQLGLTTGPALYAWEEHPEMGALIRRKFEGPGDVEKRTRELAQRYADKAKEVLQQLPESEAKGALEVLAEKVIRRKS